MGFILVGLCLFSIVTLYFVNNPMKHGTWFMIRRFLNWFPLGMTYAFLYMGRYNLNVSKNALGSLMTKSDFGLIFAAGTITYAVSFLINGSLVDKIGGKKGILIGAIGSALANIAMGVVTWLFVNGQLKMNLVIAFSSLYAINMYFQSYGAVSIIKVKAYWFHVRERGIFGAIFGTLISFGVYFAFDWGQMIVEATKATVTGQLTFVQLAIRRLFIVEGATTDATWLVFFIPAAIMLIWAVIDVFFIKDTPEGAGFQPLDTCDASSGTGDKEYSTRELLGKVFKSPIMMTIAFVELTSGVLRNGIMQWYLVFAKEVNMAGSEFFVRNWGLLLCMTGIVGGFAAGIISDHVFQSRRGPPAAIMCGFMVVLTVVMAIFLFKSPVIVGTAAVLMTLAVIGVHSIMSGTAAADFGGKKATGTCSGIVDGFVYLGSGIQSFCIGYMTSWSWELWPIFLIPFALLGLYLSLKLWKQLPTATRKYNESMEKKKIPAIVIEADEDLEEATT